MAASVGPVADEGGVTDERGVDRVRLWISSVGRWTVSRLGGKGRVVFFLGARSGGGSGRVLTPRGSDLCSGAAPTGLSPPPGAPSGLLKSHCDPDPPLGRRLSEASNELAALAPWLEEKGRTGRECQFGGLLGARCAGDGAPPVGASDGWGMKGRDRRYDHVTRAGFVGSDASLTSWRVTTGRHRFGAVRCPDEDPVKLNAPAFNTGSVSGPAGLLRSRPPWSRRRYDFVLRC